MSITSSYFRNAVRLSKGTPHRVLEALRRRKTWFAQPTDYQHYRISETCRRRAVHAAGKIRSFAKKLELKLKERILDGLGGVSVFDFLRSLLRNEDLAGMREAQVYLTFPRMLKKAAYKHFVAIRDCSAAEEGSATCWPEAVKYLLRSYSALQAISLVVSGLRDLTQGPKDDEIGYGDRVNQSSRRGGGVQTMKDRISICIDGLATSTRTPLQRFREADSEVTYLEIVQLASEECTGCRARSHRGDTESPVSRGSSQKLRNSLD